MKFYGSLTRIVELIYKKAGGSLLTVRPGTVSSDTVISYPTASGAAQVLATDISTTTFTNKTFDANGTGNSITNIENADIAAGAAIAFSKLASLATGHIIAGNGGVATDVTVSGDVTISNTGSVQIAAGAIVNADINASAAIDATKIANGSVSNAEFQYLDGVTSAIQTQLDAIAYGTDWKSSVRAATTVAGTLVSDFEDGDVIDGVTLATGDRILIKNQAAGAANGIYTVNASGAPTRAVDADSSAEVTANMAVFVAEGTANGDSAWILTTDDPITLGTTALVFVKFANFGAHSSLSGLTSGDDHTQYALLAGRTSGQTLSGGVSGTPEGNLNLQSTGDSAKGYVTVGDGSAILWDDPANSFATLMSHYIQSGDKGVGAVFTNTATTAGNLVLAADNAGTCFIPALNSAGSFASPSAVASSDELFTVAVRSWSGSGDFVAGQKAVLNMATYAAESHASTYGTGFRIISVLNGGTTRKGRIDLDGTGQTILGDASVASGTNLIWAADGSGDIGASGATRPNNAYVKLAVNAASAVLRGSTSGTFTQQAANTTSSYSVKWPDAQAASPGYVLANDSAGNLSWVSNASSASFSSTVAAASASPQTVNHALSSTDVMVQIFEIATGETIEVDTVVRTDANNVTLTFSEAVPASGWRVLVLKM